MTKSIDLGKMITMTDGHTRRILKEDSKGLYVIKGGIRNYVKYHERTGKYMMTGEWEHK